MGRVNVGDLVRFVDEMGEGRVVRLISESIAEVKTNDGWVLPANVRNLVVIPEPGKEPSRVETLISEVIFRQVEHEKEVTNLTLNKPPVAKSSKVKSPAREIDLHINKIADSVVGLTNTEILGIQMELFRRELNRAIRDNESEIVFIHGIGNGTLNGDLTR